MAEVRQIENPEHPAPKEDWGRIVAQIYAGEGAGQEALYRAFGRGLRFYFTHQLRTEDVDDKLHDTFLAVVTAIRAGQVREPDRLPGFVRTIAQRQVAGYIAESVRRRSDTVEFSPDVQPQQVAWRPEEAIILRQKRQFAEKILKALPAIDREILVRFYLEGQPAEKICAQLKLTETQFRLRKSRAKERFSKMALRAMGRAKSPDQFLLRKPTAAGH